MAVNVVGGASLLTFLMYGNSGVSSASKQKLATSARVMEPASPSMTLMMPLGGSRVRPKDEVMTSGAFVSFSSSHSLCRMRI